mgnify:CR=1 FL=1
MFKVVLNDGSKIPDEKILYIISKNGVYLKKKVGVVESITKVSGVSFLQEIKPYAKLHIPKIPLRTFGRIMTFFRKIYDIYHSECNAILYYNEVQKKFRIIIPPQEVSRASVKYIRIPSMEGYVRLSTIHSHPGFSASHSGIDIGDEKDSDGLHITVGNIMKPIFEIVAAVVVGGTRFKVDPQDYIDGIQKVRVTVPQPEIITTYRSPYYAHLFKDLEGISLVTEPSYEEGYRFVKWSKKFERYNPNWLDSVKPGTQEIATFDFGGWNEGLGTFDEKTIFRDILPEPGDIKQERREIKEFNPCGKCAFRSFKTVEEKKLIGESHGT